MNPKCLVSIIIPVFNTPPYYLNRCLCSVLEQSYPHLEVIVVDDGSDSATSKRCDDAAENDGRIRVLHKGHRGVSSARNFGLENAHGDWIAFVDSDDEILPSFVSNALVACLADGGDIAFGRTVRVEDYRVELSESWFSNQNPTRIFSSHFDLSQIAKHILSGLDVLSDSIPRNIDIGPCAKLFRANIARNLRFDEDVFISEDRLYNSAAVLSAKCVLCCDEVWYSINIHQESATKSFDQREWLAGLRSAAMTAVPPDMQNSLIVGCHLQALYAIEQIVRQHGLVSAWRMLKAFADDEMIGSRARIDLSEFELSFRRSVLLFLSTHRMKRTLLLALVGKSFFASQ